MLTNENKEELEVLRLGVIKLVAKAKNTYSEEKLRIIAKQIHLNYMYIIKKVDNQKRLET